MATANISDIERALAVLVGPGNVVELRILHTRRATVSGYFTDMGRLAQAATQWSGGAPGVYITLNPVIPDLLARSANHLKEYVKYATSDDDIVCRRWLPLDFDPKRPSEISSTEEQHKAAVVRAKEVQSWLKGMGWPDAIFADSGNGAHILPRIDLPNIPENIDLLKKCLKAVALQFDDGDVGVDQTTYNASRIWKLYGTMACKGDSMPDRPHRLAKLLDVPSNVEVVSRELLERLAAMVPEEHKKDRGNNRGNFDLQKWIQDHGLDLIGPHPWQGGQKWIFPVCPWNPEHTNKAAYLIQSASGAIAAGCHHNGCTGKGWHDLRYTIEPENLSSDYRDPPSEVRLGQEVNLGTLQANAKNSEKPSLSFLPVLGHDRLIVKGWSHLIAGYPKAGKTELVVRMIAEWPEERVLYITEEPESVWDARMRELPENYGHAALFYGLGVKPAEILDRVTDGEETVVILDTVRNLLGLRDETDNSEVARTMNPYIAAAREDKKTLIMLHHNRKGGGDHGEGITGGHAFLAVVDLALELKFDGADDSRRRQLRGWGRVIEVPKLLYELQDDNTMIALGSPAQVALNEVKERVRKVLSDKWLQKKKIRGALDDPKPSDDQVGKALNALGADGKAERDPPLLEGQRPGARYKWRLASNLTSDDPPPRSEVRLGEEKVPKEGQCQTFNL